MLSKTKITKKKFYGKWLYKITLQVKGAGIFRSKVLEEITDLCKTGKKEEYQSYTLLYKTLANSEQISDLASFLKSYNQDVWSKRIEHNSIDFYTNELDFYNSISIRYSVNTPV